MVRTTIVELLEGAPHPDIQRAVHAAVADVSAPFDVGPPEVRMTKVGPKLYVELVAAVAPEITVADQQHIYDELHARLDVLPLDIWLTVELTPRPSAPVPGTCAKGGG
jgi:predicted Co/Zn/Cd cation transporter (cation efflux family)